MIIGVPKETKTDEYRIGLLAVDEGHAAAVNIRDHRLVNKAVSGVYPDLPRG